MSSVKEYLHEVWSQVDAEVTFNCPHCRNPVSAWLKIPGDQEQHCEEVSCEFDDEEAWTVIIHHNENGWSAELEDAPDVDVTINVDDSYDDWDEPEPEPEAYGNFRHAIADWKVNVRELGNEYGASSRNRMLFVTLYSIAEAYFSDAIIGVTMEDRLVQRQLLKLRELGLKDTQITLETSLDQPNIVRDMLKANLQGLSFHNLVLVNQICEVGLGKPILPRDQAEKALAFKSIQKRHDCIHRNGFERDGGQQHTDINAEYLWRLGAIFETMAETLENAVRDAKAKKFLEPLRQ